MIDFTRPYSALLNPSKPYSTLLQLYSAAQVIVGVGKPIRELRVQAFNASSDMVWETVFRKAVGVFKFMAPAGRAYAFRPVLPAAVGGVFTFKTVITPAGDGKPTAAAQEYAVRGSVVVT